jgi:putative transcriptional regulator
VGERSWQETGPWAPTLTGRLLVAAPELRQPEFERTVVLLLEHGPDGAVGVVLNRPLPVDVGEEFPDWGRCPVLADPGVVFAGGPVEVDAVLLVALARAGAGSVEARRVTERVVVVPFDHEPEDAPDWAEGVRLFAGYAGWAAGQLEDELAAGAWHVVDSRPGDLVAAHPEGLWRAVLRRQGGDLAMLSTWTADATAN